MRARARRRAEFPSEMNLVPKLRTFSRVLRRIRNWPTAVDLRLRQRKPGLRLLSFRNGLNVLVRGGTHDWDVVNELALADAYAASLDYLRRLNGEPVVLDLGANLGVYSLLAAAANPKARVIAYEPGPPNHRMFELNRLANPDLAERIELRGEAVGGETRGTKFYYDESNPQASGVCYARGKEFAVQVRAFDEILQSLPGPVAVAKIDIEGAEFEMLERTPPESWKRVSVMSIEIHDDPANQRSLGKFLERMKSLGFRYRLEPVGTCTYFFDRAAAPIQGR